LNEVRAVEEHARVDVPGNAEELIAHDVRLPDAGKIVALVDDLRCRHARVQRLDSAQCGQLGDPGVADLRDIGKRIADVRRQQLLVRRRPRDLLHVHADVGILAMKLRQKLDHDLAFAAETPELDGGDFIPSCSGTGEQQNEEDRN
jgi:hypothetical protein